jgi:hypothetical protein
MPRNSFTSLLCSNRDFFKRKEIILNERDHMKVRTCNNIDTLFKLAINNNNVVIVKEILTKYFDDIPSFNLAAGNNYAIRKASQLGFVEIVKLLMSHSLVDPSVDNNFTIISALNGGHVELAKLLLSDDRIDPSADNNSVIKLASQKGYDDIVAVLLSDNRVDPFAGFNFPIRISSEKGHFEVAKLLLSDARVDPSDFIVQ